MNNLLPENYEKDFKIEKIFRICFAAVLYLSLVFVVGTVFLLPSYFVLFFSFGDTLRGLSAEKISFQRRNAESLESKVSSLNSMLNSYNRNELKNFNFSNILQSFLNVSGNGIKIESIVFDKNQEDVFFMRISGEASLRNDIISYVQRLKGLEEIYSVRSPVSNLLKDSNAPFIIEADIKKEFYEQK